MFARQRQRLWKFRSRITLKQHERVNSLPENSPCSYQTCGTSAQCTYWPLDPALEDQRTAWIHAPSTVQKDTLSWTSCTSGGSRQPVDHPLWSCCCFPYVSMVRRMMLQEWSSSSCGSHSTACLPLSTVNTNVSYMRDLTFHKPIINVNLLRGWSTNQKVSVIQTVFLEWKEDAR